MVCLVCQVWGGGRGAAMRLMRLDSARNVWYVEVNARFAWYAKFIGWRAICVKIGYCKVCMVCKVCVI